jgi:hypothetical protein
MLQGGYRRIDNPRVLERAHQPAVNSPRVVVAQAALRLTTRQMSRVQTLGATGRPVRHTLWH